MMRIIETCAECLYDKQANFTDNKEYLKEVKELIDNRGEDDTAPYMVYLFDKIQEKYFGEKISLADEKKKYNDLVLSMEDKIRHRIESDTDPLLSALAYARIGNYIDFGAMSSVNENEFLSLFNNITYRNEDIETYDSFVKKCEKADSFLLIADNCGEIVLDKLFIEQLAQRYPALSINVLVRGSEVLNDATLEDAIYTGVDKYATIYTNGLPLAGTVYNMLPDDTKNIINNADVILSKGQGNYETLCEEGLHIFYSFLCKCDMFVERFNVPRLTGMFIET